MNKEVHRLPDCIIIGAMKAGTTSLYVYLVSHPRVARCKRKEPSFFTKSKWEKGVNWYAQLFPNDDRLKCEASTNYTKYPGFGDVPRKMYETIPDVKLIYVVRHPVERAISQFHHKAVRAGGETGIIDVDKIRAHRQLTAVSMYYSQLSRFLEYFDLSQIKVLRFEDLITDPLQCMWEVSDFLNIDRSFYTADFNFKQYNKLSTSVRTKQPILHTLLYKANQHKILPPVYKFLQTPVPRPQFTLEAKQYIWDTVTEDLDKFESLIGRSLEYQPPA